jgi:hypothetical protein
MSYWRVAEADGDDPETAVFHRIAIPVSCRLQALISKRVRGGECSMRVLCVCGIALSFTLTLALVSAAPAAPDISGTYWTTSYGPKMQVLGGGEPPLNAAGGAAYEMNQAGLKDGSIVDKARRVCVPDGVPRVGAQDPDDEASMNNDPIEISK